jgi:hypothetical protein
MNKKNQNGVENVLTPDLQKIREQVVADELKARHWRAQWETAYYHLEFEKILPEYETLLKKKEEERQEFLKKQQEYFNKLNEEAKQKAEPKTVTDGTSEQAQQEE